MKKSSTKDFSDIGVTRITIGTSNTTTTPPCGLNVNPNIDDIRQSATPDLRYYDKLDTSIDGKFTNNLVVLPIFTDALSEKISNSSSWDLHTRVGIYLAEYPVNYVTPQFVYLEISIFEAPVSGPPIPELEGLGILPIGVRQIIFLRN